MSHDDYLGDASPDELGPGRSADESLEALAARLRNARVGGPRSGTLSPGGLATVGVLLVALSWTGLQCVTTARPAASPGLVEPPRLKPLRDVTVDVAALDKGRSTPVSWNDLFDIYGLEQPLQIRTLDANASGGRRPDPAAAIVSPQVKLVLSGYADERR
jgi:hypothetical protein